MSAALDIYVLDTSAWLTLIEDEAGADRIEVLLDKARVAEIVVLVSFMSFMEVYYITLQERDQSEAQARIDLMAALPGLRVDSTEALDLLASELKAKHHMSVADAWLAALAQARNATLVHKGPEFEQVEATIKVLKLPYKVGSLTRIIHQSQKPTEEGALGSRMILKTTVSQERHHRKTRASGCLGTVPTGCMVVIGHTAS